jgi:hypothetical protein
MINLNSELTTTSEMRIITDFVNTLNETRISIKRIQERRRRSFNEIANIIRMISIERLNNNINNEDLEDVKIVLSEDDYERLPSIENINEDIKCSICLENIEKNEKIKDITCKHEFHIECLKMWLCNQSVKCPICRFDLRGLL